MSDYGRSAGISFKFGGTIANSLPAHRLIQYFQEAPQGSPELADRIVNSLYILYFEQEAHPADDQTLLHAATEAGISLEAAQAAIRNRTEGVQDVKALIREQVGDGVDSVPYIVFEGKKRDFTLVGAQEVGEYVQALEQVAKESE
ncbi:MAG: hypothetical protein M1838_000449 [Thelocarpon superellum]|nr:MAG: hypothetical protein M1838_000449 [Thelocarpon superellum]